MDSARQYDTVKIEKNGDGITWLYLNRPEKRNAMNPRLHEEMVEVIDDLAWDDETKVLVVTGAGETFCAGMDIKEYFRDLEDNPREFQRINDLSQQWRYHQLTKFPKPTIAMVNGWCLGGGFTQVTSCDFGIAAEEAQFSLSEVNWGIIPGGLVSKVLVDAIGWSDALYYTLTGEAFDGKHAAEIKLVNKAVPLAELRERTTELARVLMTKDVFTYRATREAMRGVRNMDVEQSLDFLASKQAQLEGLSPAAKRTGMREFLDTKTYRPGLGAFPTS
jgi:feruloyl-CoA hydratase/lyase